MKKDAYYFSHDSNARNDEKVIELRMDLGWEGYGLYWAIVEMLRDATGYKLKNNAKRLNFELKADEELIHNIINNYELFEIDGDYFYSDSLMRRMEIKEKKIEQARKAANKRWGKKEDEQSDSNADALDEQSDSNAIKGKEKKEKIDYNKLLEEFNKITGKRARVVPEKTKKQIRERIKDGYTLRDIWDAIKNCSEDEYHKDSKLKYLTLEFITRSDKLERWSQAGVKAESINKIKIG